MEIRITALNLQTAIHPDDPELYALRAIAYHQGGESKQAIEDIETAGFLNPDLKEAATNPRPHTLRP